MPSGLIKRPAWLQINDLIAVIFEIRTDIVATSALLRFQHDYFTWILIVWLISGPNDW
jgi:hypothetical protein